MENLPPEILENVFHPLSKKEDIENCSNVNSKWRNVIEKMFATIGFSFYTLEEIQKCFHFCTTWQKSIEKLFETKSKILVVGGYLNSKRDPIHNPLKNPAKHFEIIDLINTKMTTKIVLDEYGLKGAAIGGILQNQPLICGGEVNYPFRGSLKITHVFIIGAPNNGFKLIIPRGLTSSVVLNESKLWATGGYSGPNLEKSTEIISLDQPSMPGPDLPFTIWTHSMVHVDPTAIYLIGGIQNDKLSNKTWIIDPTNEFQIKVGPSLNIARNFHSCSKMRIEGRIYLVVAGGFKDPDILDSVELLDTSCPDQGWKKGPKLPVGLFHSTIISSPTGMGVMMIGGRTKLNPMFPDILELSGDSKETLEWKTLDQKLQYPRIFHLSVSISNDIAANLMMKSIGSSVQN